MKLFETDRLSSEEDLVIAIYWIGHHIEPSAFKNEDTKKILDPCFKERGLPCSESSD